jgi:putative lipase involved disintegration of autophagic bodies
VLLKYCIVQISYLTRMWIFLVVSILKYLLALLCISKLNYIAADFGFWESVGHTGTNRNRKADFQIKMWSTFILYACHNLNFRCKIVPKTWKTKSVSISNLTDLILRAVTRYFPEKIFWSILLRNIPDSFIFWISGTV